MMHAVNLDALRSELEASRAELLAAIGRLAERDFAATLPDGETVVATLAALAPQEREAVHAARAAVGAPPRPRLGGDGPRGRALPPQVVHDLAGARYETQLFLDELREADLGRGEGGLSVGALLSGIAERERTAAAAIAAHLPGGAPRNP